MNVQSKPKIYPHTTCMGVWAFRERRAYMSNKDTSNMPIINRVGNML